MAVQTSDRTRFNQQMDKLVENVVSRNLVSPEYRAEYVKAAGLFKRVAETDPQLAQELLFSATMLSYYFAIGVISKFTH